MHRLFETLIVLIMFYGVFAAFDRIALLFSNKPSTTLVVMISLLVSILILWLYAHTIKHATGERYQKDIEELNHHLKKKEQELADAFAIKEAVDEASSKTIGKKSS